MADRVSVSVTHQFEINNEKAWVKLEFDTELLDEESTSKGFDRANNEVQKKIIDVIESSAKTVMDYENGDKK